MSLLHEQPVESDQPPMRSRFFTAMVNLALSMILGIILAQFITSPIPWFILALTTTLIAAYQSANHMFRSAGYILLLTALSLSAIWSTLYTNYLPKNHIAHYITEQSQLISLEGQVITQPRITQPAKGAFKAFTYKQPGTTFLIQVTRINANNSTITSAGKLLVRMDQSDHRLTRGTSLSLIGWVRGFQPPANPGEFDYKTALESKDIVGTLHLESREHWKPLPTQNNLNSFYQHWQRWRSNLAAAAMRGLEAGFTNDQHNTLSLLKPLLLGDWRDTDYELSEQYRRVGLSHILSISGAHLGILLGFAWLLGSCFLNHPRRTAIFILLVLAMYLLILPVRIPIMRAAIMATCLCFSQITGRPVRAINAWAFAIVLALILNPTDIFTPGFQLSFAIVGTLLLYTASFSKRIHFALSLSLTKSHKLTHIIRSRIIDYLAVSVIAFLTALPIVAWHFQILSPAAIALSFLAIPFLSITLILGFFKIAIFFLLPSISILLAFLLHSIVWLMQSTVDLADSLPLSSLALNSKPSLLWVCVATCVALLFFAGKIRLKRITTIIILLALGLWLFITPTTQAIMGYANPKDHTDTNLHLYMFAVGDGSCYLLRYQDRTLMFDCGSQAYLDVAIKSIIPSMRQLGINQIDELYISHPDIDHFSGTLDLADAIPIKKVITTYQLKSKADFERHNNLNRATRYLIDQLNARNIPIHFTSTATHASTQHNTNVPTITQLWPPQDYAPKHDNDASIVLRVDYANWSLLLTGDIQADAINHLQNNPALLDIDITDLPHHGSFIKQSPEFIELTSPAVVLQSSGYRRLQNDPWPDLLSIHGIERYTTATHGMTHLELSPNGGISIDTFKSK